jgi:hypothetical protein
MVTSRGSGQESGQVGTQLHRGPHNQDCSVTVRGLVQCLSSPYIMSRGSLYPMTSLISVVVC